MGGKAAKYPEPTAEERALQSTQDQLLLQQQGLIQQGQHEQALIAPYLYKQMGLDPVYGPDGRIESLEPIPGFQDQQDQFMQYQLNQMKYASEMQPLQAESLEQQLMLQGQQGQYNLEQMRLKGLLDPFTYEQMGLTPQMDESGKIIGFEKRPDTPEEARQKEILGLEQERSLAALEGELPVHPTTARESKYQEGTTRETLRRQLGSGWETSTPGREAIERFGQTKAGVLAGAARGELSMAEQLGGAREASQFQKDTYRQGQMRGVGPQAFSLAQALGGGGGGGFGAGFDATAFGERQRAGLSGMANQSFETAGKVGGLYSGVQSNLGTLGDWRGQQFKTNVAKQQQEQGEQQMYGALAGAAASAAGAAALISTRRTKKDVKKVTGDRSLREVLNVS